MIVPGDADPAVAAGFDRLAPVYDLAARLLPGDPLRRSVEAMFPAIPPGGSVLVVGGGAGRVLPALLATGPCRVVWLDASRGMISRARRRAGGDSRVEFRVGGLERVGARERCDAVVTPFFLDLWEADRRRSVIERIAGGLRRGGVWIQADFAPGHGRVLVALLYRLFRSACAIEARRLDPWDGAFRRVGLEPVRDRTFFCGRIRAEAWALAGRVSSGAG